MMMPTQHISDKETFKLLQLSDDSKSLSDLELPELTNQRKRKILRKTRNTSPVSGRNSTGANNHHHHRKHYSDHSGDDEEGAMNGINSFTNTCSHFSIWIAIIMTCGWLFILSYMTAVVYNENRRLEIEMNKLLTTTNPIPDELQKWHATSKWLEQNQTSILTKFEDVGIKFQTLDQDLKLIREEVKKQFDGVTDHENIENLQKNIAQFGAQMKDMKTEVVGLKQQIDDVRVQESMAKENISKIFDEFIINSKNKTITSTDGGPSISNETISWLVHNLTDSHTNELDTLMKNLNSVNDTLTQRVQGVDKDMQEHTIRLNNLTDNFVNVTSHVASIENDLVRVKEIIKTSVSNNSSSSSSASTVEINNNDPSSNNNNSDKNKR